MKLNLSKEWLTKRAERDDKAEISAGVFSIDMLSKQRIQQISSINASVEEDPQISTFGGSELSERAF